MNSIARAGDIETSHGRVSILDSATGELPLLMIHGNSLCNEVFLPLVDAFAGRCRMIAIDLPGHGRSSDAHDPPRTYSLAGYADCATEVLAGLGIERAAVLGWSLGGHVAFEMTARYSGLSGVMAICAPPFERRADGSMAGFLPNPKLALAGAPALNDAEIDEFVRLISDYAIPPEPFWRWSVARTDGRARQFLFESILAPGYEGQRALAEACRIPLAMVVGGEDPFVDMTYLAGLDCPALWMESVQIIDGQGHAPHIHAPERFNALLARFLDGL